MLKELGRKAEFFSGFSQRSADVKQLKGSTVEIQIEILNFLTGLIKYFRTESFGTVSSNVPLLVLG